jgi:uncharacterized membrane protein
VIPAERGLPLKFLPSFTLGLIAGLRSMTAPAAAARGVRDGVFRVSGSPVEFMGYRYSPAIFALLAAGELVTDKLPITPSRKTPPQFFGRILSGALVGATAAGLGATAGSGSSNVASGVAAGAAGAVAGTLGGAALRGKLASAFGKDLPAALLEDALAIGISVLLLTTLSKRK